MTFDLAQYLRIYDAESTYQRWQGYYDQQTVTWEGADWIWTPFKTTGIMAGTTGDETAVTLTVPAIPRAISALYAAQNTGRFIELHTYQFDPANGDQQPQIDQSLVAIFRGQIVGGSASLTELRFQLGNALVPIGAQIPPRTMTTRLIGKGCRL